MSNQLSSPTPSNVHAGIKSQACFLAAKGMGTQRHADCSFSWCTCECHPYKPLTMQSNLFPPVRIPGARAVSDECSWKKHHSECTSSWCECACHPEADAKRPFAQHSTIYLVGPKPGYLQYFHNIISSGYSDSILHESSYTVELTFVDRQSCEDSLSNVKSITLEYELIEEPS